MANQISVFLDPALMPSQSQPQATFDQNMAAFFASLPAFGAQFNAAVANFNASFSGNAYAIPYTVDLSGTSDVDPGAGKLRFDNVTQNLATTLRLDLLGAGTPAVDYTAMIDTFDGSTSTVKGHIRIVKQGDASKFLLFSVSSRTAPSGYRDISVTPVASSSANPFVAGDAVLLFFQRTGDKGDTGPAGSNYLQLLSQATVGTAVANIDFLSVFSSTYDTYIVEIEGMLASASSSLQVWMAKAGAVDATANYYTPIPDGGTTSSGNTLMQATSGIPTSGSASAFSATLRFRNANSATLLKGLSIQGFGSGISCVREGGYYAANAVTGFRLAASSGNITAGTIRIYGLKNS